MEGGAVGHIFERETPRDHLCQVWLHFAKQFQRRRFFETVANKKQELPLTAIFVGGTERNGNYL
jgi:hypothetical protein